MVDIPPKTRYASHYALAELPYFDVRDGRLVATEDFGPIVDVHTHLALSFGVRGRVDLMREHDRTEHYLPLERELDLEVYINKNFTTEDLKRLTRDLTFKSLTAGGMRATHTAPNLGREMQELSITSSVLLPIDFPWLSRNAEAYLDVAAARDDIVSLGSVHPFAKDPRARLEAQKAAGARGIKVHPAVQLIAPDHPRAMRLYKACGELGLPVLFHCGPVGIEMKRGRELSQVKHYWRAVAEHPETIFVLGHSGALQMELALELCQRYDNVYLESSSQSLTNVRRIIDEAPSGRVMFGSDWPFYHQAAPLAKVLLATEGDPVTRCQVLWDNAAAVFGLQPRKK